MRSLRKILFYLFVVIYLIGCPLIIMFVLGRVINTKTQKIVNTGLIYISSIPHSATIYINDKIHYEKTPAIIRDLPVGNYNIKLVYHDFRPYLRNVMIEAKKAVTLDYILLIPKKWKKDILSNNQFEDLVPILDSPLILIRKGKLMKDLFFLKAYEGFERKLHTEDIISLKAPVLKSLLGSDSIFLNHKIINLYTVKGSMVVVLQLEIDKKISFCWVNLRDNEAEIIDITDLFVEPPQQIMWDAEDDKDIFSFQNNYINHLDIQQKAIYPKIIRNVNSYTIFNRNIYTYLQDSTFKKWDYKGTEQEQILSEETINYILSVERNVTPFVFKKNTFLFYADSGSLLLNHHPYEITEKNIKGFNWEKKDKKLLIWTKNKIGIIEIKSRETDVSSLQNEFFIDWVVDGKRNIKQVFWANKESHVIYSDSNTIYIAEAESKNVTYKAEVANIKKDSKFYYSDVTGKVYYLDNETDQFESIEIIPSHSIIPQPITEEINLVGGKKDL